MKFRIKNLSQFRKILNSKMLIVVNQTLRDKKLQTSLGNIVKKEIQDTTFAAANPVTQIIRKHLEKYNKTAANYDRSIINITFTGELLKDLVNSVITDTTKGEFIFKHSNKKHKRYKGASGPIGKPLSFKKISKDVQDRGYDYLKITPEMEKQLIKKIKSSLRKELKKVDN